MAKLLQSKILLCFLHLILYTSTINAQWSQDDDDRTFFGGLALGTNFTQVDGDNFAGYHKVGINTGVVVYTKLVDQLHLSMELLYAQKGSRAGQSQVPKIANDQSTLITDYKIQLNYAEIPILLNYFDRRKSNFGAGFSYAQLVNSKEIYTDGQGNKFESDAKLFPFKKMDINFILNGNAHLYKGFFLNLRYQYSLLSVRDTYNYITGRPSQFNNTWCTRLLYIF
jgi:hypothetical protein